MELIKIDRADFDFIYSSLTENFPEEERRDYTDAAAVLDNKKYSLFHIILGGDRVGFISTWQLNSACFVEHFVIYEAYRSKGLGTMTLSLLKKRFERIVLEAEPPISDIQKRRIAFYERCGFVANAFPYLQPSYRNGGKEVPLALMSYPAKIDDANTIVSEIHKTVYNKF